MTVTVTVREEGILGLLLEGELTEADYTEILIPALEEVIDQYRDVRMLLQVRDFGGWTVGGAWEDLKNWPMLRHVGRMAFVSDESWDEVLTWMFKAYAGLTGMDVRFFREQRLEEAWQWVREPA